MIATTTTFASSPLFLIAAAVVLHNSTPLLSTTAAALSVDYYSTRCPSAETTVKIAVRHALTADPTLAAALLRLHFHDCFIQGCDASVLIDSTEENTAEKESPLNKSLRGYELVDAVKLVLEEACPGLVSCADILAMAARDAVFFAGGPGYEIAKGRKDGRRSRIEDAVKLPQPGFNVSDLLTLFGRHGFSTRDLVALAGGHTLGVARCSSFKNRLTHFDAAHQVDPSMNSHFAGTLTQICRLGDDTPVPFGYSPVTFDNDYFILLQMGKGLLFSDQELLSGSQTTTGEIVNAYAANEAMFFVDFQQAMVKMGLLDVKGDDEGEVRVNCRRVN
ncbi:Peroxidase 47 [Platanthera zijinensis]|uniref:Peroxidase n=1 Tax=Platanthera zijinensis TaxID=2320716 RepID=A0AAP0GCA2_9ASPA